MPAPAASLREVDAAALAALGAPDEPPSLPLLGQAGYIVEGWSHLVSGYPKAGKTELLFCAVVDWLRDRARSQSGLTVLWFSEESEHVWRQRLAQAARRGSIPPGLRLVFGLGEDAQALLARAAGGPEAVVIVDTLRYLLGLVDENDNAQIAAALRPWEAVLARQGKTRIYVHHERKGGGTHGQAIAGGSAFLAVVDRALEVTFDEHSDRRRKITVRSRISQPAELLYEQRADGTLVALGSPDAVACAEVRARVEDLLRENPGVWRKTAEVYEGLDEPRPSRRLVADVLDALYRAGRIERDPAEDRRGATYRWRAPAGPGSGPVSGPVETPVGTSGDVAIGGRSRSGRDGGDGRQPHLERRLLNVPGEVAGGQADRVPAPPPPSTGGWEEFTL